MKKLLFSLFALTIYCLGSYAQSKVPPSFHYQSILRDLTGTVMANENLGIQVSIIQTSPKQDTVYIETHATSSGFSGQIDLDVGLGNMTKGSFETINWGAGSYSIDVALAIGGGTDYTITFTQPLHSVPYALQTNKAGGLQVIRAVKRDMITTPKLGQIIFCSDCGDGEMQVYNGATWVNVTGDPTKPGSILVQKLAIEYANTFTYDKAIPEGAIPFQAEAWPDSAADKSVKWSVDDESIGVVDQNGLLQFKNEGAVTLSVVANDCGGAKATRKFTFLDAKTPDFVVNFIKAYGDTAIFVDDSKQMLAALDSFQELDTLATWASLDPSIVSITTKGIITANAEGTAQIVVTASEYPTLTDTVTIYARTRQEPFNAVLPTIVVDGFDGEIREVFIQRHDTVPFPQIFAIDYIQDTIPHTYELRNLSGALVSYDSNSMGTTLLIVTATDSFSNVALDTFSLVVGDQRAPVISIAGGINNGDTLNSNNAAVFSLPTATAQDEDGSTITVSVEQNGYSSTSTGQFIIEYTATDISGNTTTDSVILFVADSLAPTITFAEEVTAGDTLIAGQNLPFTIPTAYAIDNNGDTLTYEVLDGGLDPETLGLYTLTYGTQDSSGNADTANLTVSIIDITAPEILNKIELQKEAISLLDSTPRKLTQVLAVDNIGIASYSLTWMEGGENFEGEIWIDDTGSIFVTDSSGFAFQANFFYKIRVIDSSGLQDSTVLELIYSDGKLRNVFVKQFEQETWNNIGAAYGDPSPHSSVLKYEYNVGDTVLFFTARSNAFNELDTFLFDPTAPGAGSGDFELEHTGEIFRLKLKNAFDTATRKTYNLKFNMITRNTIDTTATVSIPIFINFTIESVRTSNPELNNIIPTSVSTSSIKLSDIMFISTPSAGSIACPLSFANGIMGDLGNALDAAITSLPIIPENTARTKAKELIRKLPAYFWLRNDNGIVRMNAKVPVKGKSVEIEYVSDNGDCYWVVLLDKLKLTSVNSRLSALDNDTKAGIIVTTKTITEANFECIQLPCLKVGSGAHAIAIGNPLAPSGGNGFATALLDPTMLAIVTPLSSGFSDPNLKVTMVMKADFTTEFNKELVRRMTDQAATAKAAIALGRKGLELAAGPADKALRALTGNQISLNQAQAAYDRAASALSAAQSTATKAAAALSDATAELSKILTNDEICTPNVCVLPCFTIGWCSKWYGGYPCTRGCGCYVELREVCVPNPVAKALAFTFGKDVMNGVRSASNNANWYLRRATSRAAYYTNPLNSAQAAFDAATTAYNTAKDAKDKAQDALDAVNINTGQLGKVGNYLLDNTLGKTVSTSSITFETKLSAVENGTLSGKFTFQASILGAPNITVTTPTVSLTGADMETALEAVVDQLINLIP